MRSQIHTFSYPNGEIQRVQAVYPESWEKLSFLPLRYEDPAFDGFCHIYRRFLVPSCPWIFGNLVLFRLPEGIKTEFPNATKAFGEVADPLTAAAVAMRGGMRIVKGKPVFSDDRVKKFWAELEVKKSVRVVSGKLPVTTVIPVGPFPGYLSKTQESAALKVNASFFIMDRFDCATVYDHIGTPLGLCVKDGKVLNPPLFRREALLVKDDGSVRIETPDVKKMNIEIRGQRYRHGENALVYSRPERKTTPRSKEKKLIIVGNRVAAVVTADRAQIPASGFVLCVPMSSQARPGDAVIYRGMEDVRFCIQVGNSILRNGEKTEKFISRFYNVYALEPVPFPPSLYPLDFEKARAARIALGSDKEGDPVLLWAEGAGKLRYTPGEDSCGASLSEMAQICSQMGLVNAVNLDGGGSAQILVNNRRSLRISDRKAEDNSEQERAIPLGLMVEG